MLGYLVIATIIAAGMAYAIHGISVVADHQVADLRNEENAVTAAERLRWSSELIVSRGRAYLITGDPSLLAEVQKARTQFAESVRLIQENGPQTSAGAELMTVVQGAAARFTQIAEELLDARRRGEDSAALVTRFDAELLAEGRALDTALEHLVDHKVARLERLYDRASSEREGLVESMYGLLLILVLAGGAIAIYFSRLLGRSFGAEQQATEVARRAVATRDEVMAIVAHDLRNPLGAITMTATLLQNEASSDRSRERAATIANIAMRMEYLIKTMLDVAMMEAGRFELTPAATSVDELSEETLELFRPIASGKHVAFESRVQPHLTVRADRDRIVQVLSNLVGNALKFTPAGGRVTLAIDQKDHYARFAVADTGPGISSDKLPRVFERFWGGLTPGIKSTGLGLFIGKEIVTAHGGRIWVESSPGHGARFMFTLPLEP